MLKCSKKKNKSSEGDSGLSFVLTVLDLRVSVLEMSVFSLPHL